MNKLITAMSFASLLACSSFTLAVEPLEAEIGSRQAFMQVLKFNIGILGDMAKGSREYDSKQAAAVAKNIHSASLMDNSAMWPMGSDNSNSKVPVKTKALPAIWTDYPTVVERHKSWIEASATLAAKAGNGLSDLRTHLGAVGDACKACHKKFRAED